MVEHVKGCGCGCNEQGAPFGAEAIRRRAGYYAEGIRRFGHYASEERHKSASQWADAMLLRAQLGEAKLDEILVKADPYGVNVPTRVARPSSSGKPGPSVEGTVPRYLKPIPFNDRSISALLRSYLRTTEPKLVRWLYSTWTAQAEALKFQEIRNAIRDGEISASVIRGWRQDYSKMVNTRLAPAWRAAAIAAHAPMRSGVLRVTSLDVPFSQTAARVDAWIARRGADLVVNVSDSQRRAVRNVLRHLTVTDPVPPRELGRYLRPIVGLTDGQAASVLKFREQMQANGVTGKALVHRVENYAGYQARVRAERIARTELAFAFNQAQLDTMRTARDTGVLKGSMFTKEFYTGLDERVCPFCEPLHGTVIELEETFPGATRQLSNLYAPPVHPSCRCTVIHGIVS